MTSLTRVIPFGSPLHRQVTSRLRQLITYAERARVDREEKWRKAEESVLAYVPESEADGRRRVDREVNGNPTYTTIQVPYSYATLMSAHTYWTSVFLSRNPVFQFSGRHGESEQQVMAMEALVDYQASVGEWTVPLYAWLYDAGKYGQGVIGEYWDRDIFRRSEIIQYSDGVMAPKKQLITQELLGYTGNRIYNVSPFDFLHDPRVSMQDFQKGEFCAVRRRPGWNEIIRRERAGFYMNLDQAKTSVGTTDSGRSDGSSQLVRPTWDEDTDLEGKSSEHPSQLAIYEVYVDLIPEEWGIGNGDYPEKWVFTLTADKTLLIGCTPLGCMHNKFPFSVLEVEPEAYGTFSRGIPEIMEPVQRTMDWLINVHFYNVRAALQNLFLVDPSKVVLKDLEDPLPGGIIRLKPGFAGTDLKSVMTQFNVMDVTRTNMQDLQQMFGMGERMFGVNDQIMGMVNSGGRKTATEVRTSTSFGINRMKTTAELMSAMGFAPFAQRVVQNSQQYFDAEMKLKVVGDLVLSAGEKFMTVDPMTISGFYDFVPIDGSLPVDRTAQVQLWEKLLTGMAQVPQVLLQYDIGKIFGWVAKLGGIKNLDQFKNQGMMPGMMPGVNTQVVPDEKLSREAEKGNVVPLKSGGAGGDSAIMELAQAIRDLAAAQGAPVEMIRGADGRPQGVRKGNQVKMVRYGANGQVAGLA